MNFLNFLRNESPESWKLILAMAALSGISNSALLALINKGAEIGGADNPLNFASPRLFFMFAIAIVTFIYAKRLSLVLSTQIVETMVKNLRVRVCDKIRRSELATVEKLDRNSIFTTVSQDTNLISQSSLVIVASCQESIMLVFSLLYVAYLSLAAFLITVGGAGLAIYGFYSLAQTVHEELKASGEKEGELFGTLGHILHGFKEVRLNDAKSEDLFRSLSEITDVNRELKTKVGTLFVYLMMFSQIFLYLLLAIVVFVLPLYIPTYGGVIVKTTSTILFLVGPFNLLASTAPTLTRANVALENLYTLERTLDVSLKVPAPSEGRHGPSLADFRTISLDRVMFSYTDEAGLPSFTAGPIDLTVHRGEMIFIVGGNGSGKSTVLKLLTGLYYPSAGRVTVDGRGLDLQGMQPYRELFAAIFTDFHLFDRLYGLDHVPADLVSGLIREMEIEDKVQFEDGRFSTLNLSTGQRKRLALIVSLLEDKEIYVLDEWAADQDQHFRQRFYEGILPNLKRRGKTILAVSHDEQYWKVADRLVKLDLGRVVSDEALH
jgi:putative ATP-binding cassette transporter